MGNYKNYVRKSFSYEGRRYFIYGATEEDCLIKIGRKKAELEAGSHSIDRNARVSEWCQEWLETYKEDKINDLYYKDLQRTLDRFLISEIGYMPLRKVKPLHLQRILNGTAEYSQSYINKIYDAIHQVFSAAYANDLTATDLTKSLVRPVGKKKQNRRAVTDHERQLTLEAAKTHRGGWFILIMLYGGLRPGEVAALRWNDIDLRSNVLHVRHAVKSGNVVGDPKTASGVRVVPIPSRLREVLLLEDHEPFDLVCKTARGQRHTKCSMQEMWRSFKAEMHRLNKPEPGQFVRPIGEDLTLYCYRHTYCTDLQAAGVPINVAKELMGHSSIYVTAMIYTHRSEDAFNSAAELIDAYTSGQKQSAM